jgi:hypothetical protein
MLPWIILVIILILIGGGIGAYYYFSDSDQPSSNYPPAGYYDPNYTSPYEPEPDLAPNELSTLAKQINIIGESNCISVSGGLMHIDNAYRQTLAGTTFFFIKDGRLQWNLESTPYSTPIISDDGQKIIIENGYLMMTIGGYLAVKVNNKINKIKKEIC